jgi:hypothetical protein
VYVVVIEQVLLLPNPVGVVPFVQLYVVVAVALMVVVVTHELPETMPPLGQL